MKKIIIFAVFFFSSFNLFSQTQNQQNIKRNSRVFENITSQDIESFEYFFDKLDPKEKKTFFKEDAHLIKLLPYFFGLGGISIFAALLYLGIRCLKAHNIDLDNLTTILDAWAEETYNYIDSTGK